MSWDPNALANRVINVHSDGTNKVSGLKVDTAQGASGAAVTRTIAAVANKRHRIAFLHIIGYNVAARTGGATPVAISVTGLDNGTVNFPGATAGAIGTTFEVKMEGMMPLEGLVNTAIVVTCPATPSVIWSVIIGYTTTE